MFSTPSIRIHQENADSVMRKPQLNSARKALQDRGNNVTPFSLNTPRTKPQLKIFEEEQDDPKWMRMTRKEPWNGVDLPPLIDYKIFHQNLLKACKPSEPVIPKCPFMDSDMFSMEQPQSPMHTDKVCPFDTAMDLLHTDLNDFLKKPHANFDY